MNSIQIITEQEKKRMDLSSISLLTVKHKMNNQIEKFNNHILLIYPLPMCQSSHENN